MTLTLDNGTVLTLHEIDTPEFILYRESPIEGMHKVAEPFQKNAHRYRSIQINGKFYGFNVQEKQPWDTYQDYMKRVEFTREKIPEVLRDHLHELKLSAEGCLLLSDESLKSVWEQGLDAIGDEASINKLHARLQELNLV